MTDKDDAFLDELFADARADDPVPSDALRARVLADAAAAMAGEPVDAVPGRFWPNLAALLGGWPALGGVAAAGLAGLWVGITPPAAIETFAADMLGTTTSVSFFSELDDFVEGNAIDG